MTSYAQWEIAFIYAFTSVFRENSLPASLHQYPTFSPEDLELALQLPHSDLIDQLLCAFLSNTMNRKKSFGKDLYPKALSTLLDAKLHAFEFDLDHNPLSKKENFHTLPQKDKLIVLRSLVEWQLQDSDAVRLIIEQHRKFIKDGKSASRISAPLGFDSQKRAYWHFGNSPWIWREKTNVTNDCQWETVCRDLDQLKELPITLSDKSRAERNLSKNLKEELIPRLEELMRRREKIERAKARQITTDIVHAPRELRPRDKRKPVRYIDFDSFEAIPTTPAERPKPTRTSSRLNPNLAEDYQ